MSHRDIRNALRYTVLLVRHKFISSKVLFLSYPRHIIAPDHPALPHFREDVEELILQSEVAQEEIELGVQEYFTVCVCVYVC